MTSKDSDQPVHSSSIFFDLGFTTLSRIFCLYWADRSSKVGENRRTQGKKHRTIRKQNLVFPRDPSEAWTTAVRNLMESQLSYPPGYEGLLYVRQRLLVYPSLDSLEAVEGTCNQWRLLLDCSDAQADWSLWWSHKSYFRFCHVLAPMLLQRNKKKYSIHLDTQHIWRYRSKFVWVEVLRPQSTQWGHVERGLFT